MRRADPRAVSAAVRVGSQAPLATPRLRPSRQARCCEFNAADPILGALCWRFLRNFVNLLKNRVPEAPGGREPPGSSRKEQRNRDGTSLPPIVSPSPASSPRTMLARGRLKDASSSGKGALPQVQSGETMKPSPPETPRKPAISAWGEDSP